MSEANTQKFQNKKCGKQAHTRVPETVENVGSEVYISNLENIKIRCVFEFSTQKAITDSEENQVSAVYILKLEKKEKCSCFLISHITKILKKNRKLALTHLTTNLNHMNRTILMFPFLAFNKFSSCVGICTDIFKQKPKRFFV